MAVLPEGSVFAELLLGLLSRYKTMTIYIPCGLTSGYIPIAGAKPSSLPRTGPLGFYAGLTGASRRLLPASLLFWGYI